MYCATHAGAPSTRAGLVPRSSCVNAPRRPGRESGSDLGLGRLALVCWFLVVSCGNWDFLLVARAMDREPPLRLPTASSAGAGSSPRHHSYLHHILCETRIHERGGVGNSYFLGRPRRPINSAPLPNAA